MLFAVNIINTVTTMYSGDGEVECPVCQTQILLDKVR